MNFKTYYPKITIVFVYWWHFNLLFPRKKKKVVRTDGSVTKIIIYVSVLLDSELKIWNLEDRKTFQRTYSHWCWWLNRFKSNPVYNTGYRRGTPYITCDRCIVFINMNNVNRYDFCVTPKLINRVSMVKCNKNGTFKNS